METLITIQITPDELRKMIREEVSAAKPEPETWVTQKAAMQHYGVADYRTLANMSVTVKMMGKKKFYKI